MKKPNRSMGFDDQPDPSREADIDLESLGEDDDEIIDLEDIIEMPAGSIDEDEDIDLDVEILDAEPDLDFDDFEKPPKGAGQLSFTRKAAPVESAPIEPAQEDVEDLLKDLEDEEGDNLFGKLAAAEAEKKSAEFEPAEIFEPITGPLDEKPIIEAEEQIEPEEPAAVAAGPAEPAMNEEDDELLKSLLDELDGLADTTKPEEAPPLRERAAAALKIEDETDRAPQPQPDIPAAPEEPPALAPMPEGEPEMPAAEAPPAPEAEAPETPEAAIPQQPKIAPEIAATAAAAAAIAAAAEKKPAEAAPEAEPPSSKPVPESEPAFVVAAGNDALIAELIEELVGRIEFRLLETVRQVVEAKLPGVAREIIREEIERIKKEIE